MPRVFVGRCGGVSPHLHSEMDAVMRHRVIRQCPHLLANLCVRVMASM